MTTIKTKVGITAATAAGRKTPTQTSHLPVPMDIPFPDTTWRHGN